MKFRHLLPAFLAFCVLPFLAGAQSVSMSPSRLYYKVDVGAYKTQTVTVTNNSSVRQAFNVSFGDFEPAGYQGKSKFMKPGESEHSCSEWLTATPSFFELDPGQSQKVQVLLQVPNAPDANKVKWSAMRIKLTKERKATDLGDKNAIGMGITETFQFVVHIFQTPPTVTNKSADIIDFRESTTAQDTSRVYSLRVRNTGEAILDCASYLELTNLSTGEELRLKPMAYTVLPGSEREVRFNIPRTQPKGRYSLMGVVDYGNRDNVQAAEMEITIE
jgi:P pilus assembly chaperone PapD